MLGRSIYHKIILDGDGGFAECAFVNAIRFSTHGDYYHSGTVLRSVQHKFPHFHDMGDLTPELEVYEKIIFSGQFFEIESTMRGSYVAAVGFDSSLPARQVSEHGLQFIDYIVGADNAIEYLCSINEVGAPHHNRSDLSGLIQERLQAIPGFSRGCVITVALSQHKDEIRLNLEVNTVAPHWNLYRAIGVNIPLLVIQTLLGRKIRTYRFVDYDKLRFKNDNVFYDLADVGIFWFDLDETLICRWRPIWQTIALHAWLVGRGVKVGLITRHTFDIEQTLNVLGLSVSDFDKVIKVEVGARKSDYVERVDFFIDNEFAERLDVRENSKATVLDLDQIEFLEDY